MISLHWAYAAKLIPQFYGYSHIFSSRVFVYPRITLGVNSRGSYYLSFDTTMVNIRETVNEDD